MVYKRTVTEVERKISSVEERKLRRAERLFFIYKIIADGRLAAEKLYHILLPFVKKKTTQKIQKFLIPFCAKIFTIFIDKNPGIMYNKDS